MGSSIDTETLVSLSVTGKLSKRIPKGPLTELKRILSCIELSGKVEFQTEREIVWNRQRTGLVLGPAHDRISDSGRSGVVVSLNDMTVGWFCIVGTLKFPDWLECAFLLQEMVRIQRRFNDFPTNGENTIVMPRIVPRVIKQLPAVARLSARF
jgi:hypothetical protein